MSVSSAMPFEVFFCWAQDGKPANDPDFNWEKAVLCISFYCLGTKMEENTCFKTHVLSKFLT